LPFGELPARTPFGVVVEYNIQLGARSGGCHETIGQDEGAFMPYPTIRDNDRIPLGNPLNLLFEARLGLLADEDEAYAANFHECDVRLIDDVVERYE
jgi:hypothetical protein